jgi:hypothetical protein
MKRLVAHDGVHEEREEADLGEAAGAEGPVAVAQLVADGGHGGPADGAQAGLGSEALDVPVGRPRT